MSSVVYFARRDALVKIGTTGDLVGRVASLNRGSGALEGMADVPVVVLATMPGGVAVERALHELFAGLRYRGEWFFHEDPLTGFIAAVNAATAARRALHTRAFPLRQPMPDDLINLRQAVEDGVVPWSKSATKMRIIRARGQGLPVPMPASQRGRQILLYRRGELAAWAEQQLLSEARR